MKRKLRQYEICLKWIGKGKKPLYTETEYGFGMNPPIVIKATSITEAKEKLKLPKTVIIRSIKRAGGV